MTAIPTPLVMLGTGGDYVARYFVKGAAIAKQVGQSLEQQPDTETAGGFAGYHRSRRGQGDAAEGYLDVTSQPRQADGFEHRDVVVAATYSPANLRQRSQGSPAQPDATVPASAVAAAAEAWLAAQHRTLVAIPLFTPPAPVAAPAATQVATRAAEPATARLIPLLPATESRAARPSPVAYRTALAAWPRISAAVAPAINWTESQLQTSTSQQESDHERQSHPQTASHPHPHPRPAVGPGLLADHAGAGGRAGRQQSDRLRARRGAHPKGSPLARCQQGTLFGG